MAEYQNVGDKSSLKTGSPLNVEPTASGSVSFQNVGDKSPLKTTPTPNTVHSFKGGEMQNVGDKVNLNMTPRRGWSGGQTPMSDRTDKQGPIGG